MTCLLATRDTAASTHDYRMMKPWVQGQPFLRVLAKGSRPYGDRNCDYFKFLVPGGPCRQLPLPRPFPFLVGRCSNSVKNIYPARRAPFAIYIRSGSQTSARNRFLAPAWRPLVWRGFPLLRHPSLSHNRSRPPRRFLIAPSRVSYLYRRRVFK